jgi:hypothetical protein
MNGTSSSSDLTAGLDVELQNLKNVALSSLVSIFAATPQGQQAITQYKKQMISDYLNDPLVWVIGILIILLVMK